MLPIGRNTLSTSANASPSGAASTSVTIQPPSGIDEPACFSRTVGSTASEPPEVDLEKLKTWPKRISKVHAIGLLEISSQCPADGEKLKKSFDKTVFVLDQSIRNLANDADPQSPAIVSMLGQSTPGGVKKSKEELLDVFNKVRKGVIDLKNNSSTRLHLVSGKYVDATLAAVKVDDPDEKMIITHKLLSSSSVNQVQTLIHEITHLVRHSDDYRYAPLKYDFELTGGKVNRRNIEKSLDDQQNELTKIHLPPEEQFTQSNVAELKKGGGAKKSYASMARDAGERPRSGTKICELARNSEGFRRLVGLNNPDSIAALASAYGRDALLQHEGVAEKSAPVFEAGDLDFEKKSAERAARRAEREAEHKAALAQIQSQEDRAVQQLDDPDRIDIQTKIWLEAVISPDQYHSDYSDENLLDPDFHQLFISRDPDDDDIAGERLNALSTERSTPAPVAPPDVRITCTKLLKNPTVSASIDVISQLNNAEADVQRSALTNAALLKQLATLATLTSTASGMGYGKEAAEAITYAATATRSLLREGKLTPVSTAQQWFGGNDSPAKILLPVRLLPAAVSATQAVFVDLMSDILGHRDISPQDLKVIRKMIEKDLRDLSNAPVLGLFHRHQQLLKDMSEAGLTIKHGLFRSSVSVTAPSPSRCAPPPSYYLNNINTEELYQSTANREDQLHQMRERQAVVASTSSDTFSVSDRWQEIQENKQSRWLESNERFLAAGQRLEQSNQFLAERAQSQKRDYASSSRAALAQARVDADAHRKIQNTILASEQAAHSRAAMEQFDQKQERAKQTAAIEAQSIDDFVHRALTSDSSSALFTSQRALPVLPTSQRALPVLGASGRYALSGAGEPSGTVALPNSTFSPLYQREGENFIINAQNRQGQPVKVEVPPPQGPGMIVNYAQGVRPSSLLSPSASSRPAEKHSLPTITQTYHHEHSGVPVIQLTNMSGNSFNAAAYQGFTLKEDQRSTTYSRVEPRELRPRRDIQSQQDRQSNLNQQMSRVRESEQEQKRRDQTKEQHRQPQMYAQRDQEAAKRRMDEKAAHAQRVRQMKAAENNVAYEQNKADQRAEDAHKAAGRKGK